MINRSQEDVMEKWNSALDAPMVSIRCITYMHESYIAQALDGFLMQETNFPFEIVVHDDASVDKTADIIREYEIKYPKIVKPIYERENQYSKRNGSVAKIVDPACRGKYIALCEGDDFWIDSKKLQKQVDFLESNPDFGLCYTNFNVFHEKNKKTYLSCFTNQSQKYPSDYSLKEWIVSGGYVAPMTWLVRKNLWLNRKCDNIYSLDGTFVFFAFFLKNSKVACLKKDTTATYRIVAESAVHTKFVEKAYNRYKSLHQTQLALVDKYLKGEDKWNAQIEINRKYYTTGLKLFVLFNDRNELIESKKWVKEKLRYVFFSVFSQVDFLHYLYNIMYRLLYKFK